MPCHYDPASPTSHAIPTMLPRTGNTTFSNHGLTTNAEPYWMSANSAVAISPFWAKELAGHQRGFKYLAESAYSNHWRASVGSHEACTR